ncbi:fibrinogen C domain-containing protein 1-like [Dysidea avara]|uniref:fibrinogen C domain-containing protein 1-like n=1 Tax=Dysidea avara TaxID=196820 RepID=UPI00331E17E0
MINTVTISILVVSAIRIVLVDGECQTNGGPIRSCCCLGYNNTHFNAKSPGVYIIGNFGGVKCSNTRVYCDTTTGGGGWLVVQRRKDGSVDFNRDWIDYEDGFGSLNGEFWFGLRGMHTLTNQGQWELRIDYAFNNGTKGFDGVTTDPIAGSYSLNGMKFTTRDRDNDIRRNPPYNCAVHHVGGNAGGWWYKSCSNIFPNHQYKHRMKWLFKFNSKYTQEHTTEVQITK